MCLYRIKNFDETVFNMLGKEPRFLLKVYLWAIGPNSTLALVLSGAYFITRDDIPAWALTALLLGQVSLALQFAKMQPSSLICIISVERLHVLECAS